MTISNCLLTRGCLWKPVVGVPVPEPSLDESGVATGLENMLTPLEDADFGFSLSVVTVAEERSGFGMVVGLMVAGCEDMVETIVGDGGLELFCSFLGGGVSVLLISIYFYRTNGISRRRKPGAAINIEMQ